jgi:hypothetical protein
MTHRVAGRAGLCALALLACSKHRPDFIAPAIANPFNTVGARDVLRVRFTEPVTPTATAVVTVTSALHGAVTGAVTLTRDAVLQITPAAPLEVPDTITVTVQNLADAAGNMLVVDSAMFETTGWGDLGLTSFPTFGPKVWPLIDVARAAGITQVVRSQQRVWLAGGTWGSEWLNSFRGEALAASGGTILRARLEAAGVVVEALDAGTVTPLGPALTSGVPPVAVSAAACPGASGLETVVAWTEDGVAPNSAQIHVGQFTDGAWSHVEALGGAAGVHDTGAAVACAPGVAYVAFQRNVVGAYPPDLRLASRASDVGPWTELPAVAGADGVYQYALGVGSGGQLWLVYTEGYGATRYVRVARLDPHPGSAWQSPGALGTPTSFVADEPSLTIDGTGAPIVAWAEWPPDHPEQARVQVRRWTGQAWAPGR